MAFWFGFLLDAVYTSRSLGISDLPGLTPVFEHPETGAPLAAIGYPVEDEDINVIAPQFSADRRDEIGLSQPIVRQWGILVLGPCSPIVVLHFLN